VRIRLLVVMVGALVLAVALPAKAQSKHEITISGIKFLLNGEPFPYTGISFFNANYNKTFNESSAVRRQWMRRFQHYGINVLRLACVRMQTKEQK